VRRRGLADGDNYTPERLDQLAAAIKEAQVRYHARETVLVGRSGGAASSALLMARRPDLAPHALLVSYPCDLGRWRRHMLVLQKNPIWLRPVSSLCGGSGRAVPVSSCSCIISTCQPTHGHLVSDVRSVAKWI